VEAEDFRELLAAEVCIREGSLGMWPYFEEVCARFKLKLKTLLACSDCIVATIRYEEPLKRSSSMPPMGSANDASFAVPPLRLRS
jgi:hypothetical protein